MQKRIEYIIQSWRYIMIISGVFVASLVAGLLVSSTDVGLSENYLEMLQKSFGWIKTLSPISIMLVIFLNNAVKSLLAIVLGAGFGIIPVLFIAGNGIVLGLIASQVSREHGTIFVLAALLPHGIIEVAMVLISAGMGLRLGYFMYLSLRGQKKDMRYELMESLRTYVRIVLPFLLIAAVIETFVTPIIASMVL